MVLLVLRKSGAAHEPPRPGIGAEFDFLFISLLAQRNEPKKEHPGQGPRLSHGISKRPYHSDCARGCKCFAFIWGLYLHALVLAPEEQVFLIHT